MIGTGGLLVMNDAHGHIDTLSVTNCAFEPKFERCRAWWWGVSVDNCKDRLSEQMTNWRSLSSERGGLRLTVSVQMLISG